MAGCFRNVGTNKRVERAERPNGPGPGSPRVGPGRALNFRPIDIFILLPYFIHHLVIDRFRLRLSLFSPTLRLKIYLNLILSPWLADQNV